MLCIPLGISTNHLEDIPLLSDSDCSNPKFSENLLDAMVGCGNVFSLGGGDLGWRSISPQFKSPAHIH